MLSIRIRLTLWYSAVLLAILLVVAGLTYSVLRSRLLQDLDGSLLTVAQVVQDTAISDDADAESVIRELLGPDFPGRLFQRLEPDGRPRSHPPRAVEPLPFTPHAQQNAANGLRTFETVVLHGHDRLRVLTTPIVQDGHVSQIVQVGVSLERTDAAVRRYVDTLIVLIPLGVLLAAAGGAVIARTALRPVDEMAAAARRITAEDLHRRIALRGTGDELDRLADTLNGMFGRLDHAFSDVRRFAADAAHELRTPLTVLKGGIEVALRADRAPEDYRRVLESSLEEVDRLVRLAEDLLMLSRASAGPDRPRIAVDLEALLLDALELGTRLAQPRGVHVQLGAVVPASVRADPGALARALRNLVENAVKYTPPGGKVELSLRTADGRAMIDVQDTGIGIAAEDRARVFEPFERLDAARARETGGTGLGLAIARSIVDAHGGGLTLESAPGAGSRFTITLPLAT